MLFKTRPGKYVIPEFGKIDTTNGIPNEKGFELYKNKHFPWCEPIIKKETVSFLKKQKLVEKDIATLILQSRSKEEVQMLLEVKSSNALKGIAETKITEISSEPA